MNGLLLATLLPPVFWLTGTLALARACYQAFRPSTVPLCDEDHGVRHVPACYKQREGGACETRAGALWLAVIVASLWPVYLVLAPLFALGVGLNVARFILTIKHQ